ncbi:MAG: hypothetical protein ISR87_12050 [Candidatus Marinimicrobia bacterium]|nr:hypothetical protein [FCB group bacterium]MBL7026179.1 hypothetical protein [Candidatus Neomarinimicrobiota bacterium]
MELWEKIKESVGFGADLVHSSVDASDLSRLQAEVEMLQTQIRDAFTNLGGDLFSQQAKGDSGDLSVPLQEQIEALRSMQPDLEEKEAELASLMAKYEEQSITVTHLREFKEALDNAGGSLEYVQVLENSPVCGKTLMEIDIPDEVLAGLVIRDGTVIIPDGDTRIELDDRIVLLGKKDAVIEFLQDFRELDEFKEEANNNNGDQE